MTHVVRAVAAAVALAGLALCLSAAEAGQPTEKTGAEAEKPAAKKPAGKPASKPDASKAQKPDQKKPAPKADAQKPDQKKAAPKPQPKKPDETKAAPKPEPKKPSPAKPARGPVSFAADVLPALNGLGCNAVTCHGSAAGKGGLKLSLFAAYPEADYLAITRADEGRRIDPVKPLESLFLLKAMGGLGHEGGKSVPPGSPAYRVIRAWLEQGAPRGSGEAERLASVTLEPARTTLKKDATGTLKVVAELAGGTRRDVTRTARFQSADETVATVTQDGTVRAEGFGEAVIIATYRRHAAVARVAVPQPLPDGFPKAAVNNRIDERVHAKLKALGIPPSGPASDEVFLRRVSLDTIGILPTPDEVRTFLADTDPAKRSKRIDALLGRPEFADFWALKWGDLLRIKAEYPSNLWPNAVQAYHHWVRDAIARHRPYDAFVRDLLVSSGSNFREPPANFYRGLKKRDPQGFAEQAALVFMGARIGCARCHGHPTEGWTLDDNLGMAAFFAGITFKSTREWKEEIVYRDPDETLRHPVTREVVQPKFLGGKAVEVKPGEDPRTRFADWLTSPENPYFARNIVNRIWFWLIGRGIVHEADDLRPTNPPSHPALLDFLEKELVAHAFDLRHIYRLILNSATYQRSSETTPLNAHDEALFSHYPVKRLTAEQLSDAVGRVTQVWDRFSSRIPEPYSHWPDGFRATQMADGSVGTPFLELFGRPPRDTAFESDRNCRTSMRQALYLINSSAFERKVTRSPRIQAWMKAKTPDATIVEDLWLLTVSRPPTKGEREAALAYLKTHEKARARAVQDLMWALVNTKEFLFNH
ncbi:MAG: DUF1553 domain-containing protein [Phycisphaerae bacterium]